MQSAGEINDIGLSPSFNCYSSDSLTSTAAAKVSREVKEEFEAQFQESSDVDEEDFQFSLEFDGEEFSAEELAEAGRLFFPVFNSDLVTKDDIDREVKGTGDDDSPVIIPLPKMFLGESEQSLSSTSSEAEEWEDRPSGTFCVSWRKADVAGSPTLADCKKSRSTGSGSKRWRIKDILRRSNSAGKETVFFLCPKKVEASSKQKQFVNSGTNTPKITGKPKTASAASFHELFYVQKRAEQKGDKMKSYLPYRQDLLGFFVNVNGVPNKKLPF